MASTCDHHFKCNFFIAFLESMLNLEHLEKRDGLYSLGISEIIDSEKLCYLNARKILFLKRLRNQGAKIQQAM